MIMGWKMWKEILHTDPSFWIIYIYIYFCWLAGFGVLFHNNSIFFSAASIKCIVEPSTGENLQSHLAFVAHQMDFRSGYRGSWPPMFQAMQWEWSELWFTVGDCSAINAIVCVKNMWMTHSPAHRHTEMWGSIIGYRIAQPPCKSCPYQQHILHKQIKHWLLFWHCLWESHAITTAWKPSVATLVMPSSRQQRNEEFTHHQSRKMLFLTHAPK